MQSIHGPVKAQSSSADYTVPNLHQNIMWLVQSLEQVSLLHTAGASGGEEAEAACVE